MYRILQKKGLQENMNYALGNTMKIMLKKIT